MFDIRSFLCCDVGAVRSVINIDPFRLPQPLAEVIHQIEAYYVCYNSAFLKMHTARQLFLIAPNYANSVRTYITFIFYSVCKINILPAKIFFTSECFLEIYPFICSPQFIFHTIFVKYSFCISLITASLILLPLFVIYFLHKIY